MEPIVEALARRVTRVADLGDERLADYRQLREADVALRRKAFIAESEVVLRVLIARGRYPIRSVFLAEPRLAKLADVLLGLAEHIPIYVAAQEVLDQVVGFHIHRGILAAGERPELPTARELLEAVERRGPRRVVLLEGLTNHDNVGGVFRNAAAFGVDAVLLDGPTCDPLYRKAIRVSVGGALLVPWTRAADSAEMLAAARAAGFTVVALTPRADALDLGELARPGAAPERLALLLGTEGPGLRPETMAAADLLVRIDIAAGFDSLNVATAAGIALQALRRAQIR
jgi:tRNA G18 (ribose-2'-O)-methylase SpoU